MWKQLADFARQILTLTSRTERNQQEIEDLRQEVKELSNVVAEMRDAIKALVYELRRVEENARHEQEKSVLRLENQFLKSRELPEGKERRRKSKGADDADLP